MRASNVAERLLSLLKSPIAYCWLVRPCAKELKFGQNPVSPKSGHSTRIQLLTLCSFDLGIRLKLALQPTLNGNEITTGAYAAFSARGCTLSLCGPHVSSP